MQKSDSIPRTLGSYTIHVCTASQLLKWGLVIVIVTHPISKQ